MTYRGHFVRYKNNPKVIILFFVFSGYDERMFVIPVSTQLRCQRNISFEIGGGFPFDKSDVELSVRQRHLDQCAFLE